MPSAKSQELRAKSYELIQFSRSRCRALCLVLWLGDYAVEGSGCDESAVHDANVAEGVSGVGAAMPTVAAVFALEHHAGGRAGRQQELAALVIANGADVLVRQAVQHMFPGEPRIRTA